MPRPWGSRRRGGADSRSLTGGHAVLETIAMRDGGNPLESLLAAREPPESPTGVRPGKATGLGSDQPNAVRRRASQISEIEMRVV